MSRTIIAPAGGGAAGGTGDVVGPAASVDGEVALYSGVTGKLLKRATGNGVARLAAGVQSAAELSGDVTTSGSNAVTIANDAVTFAKMQNVSAASKLLGRGSAGGAGDPEEITLGTNLTLSGTTLNAAGGGGTTPTGTGFVHVTSGAQDAAAKLVDTADINNSQVTYAKMQTLAFPGRLLGRNPIVNGPPEEISVGSGLTLTGTVLSASGGGSGTVTTTGTPATNQVAVFSGATAITGDAALQFDPATGILTDTGVLTLGSGSTATLGGTATSLAVANSNTNTSPLVRLESTHSGTAASRTALTLAHSTTGAMADEFGVRQDFILRDSDAVDNLNARILVERSGADNTGTFTLQTAVAGTLGNRLVVDRTGGPSLSAYHAEPAPLAINTTTAETTLYSLALPAGALGTSKKLRVTLRGNLLANSGTPTFTFRVKLGATTLWGDASIGLGAMATRASWALDFVLANLNATNAQAVQGTFFASNRAAAASIAGIGDIGAVATLANPFGGTAAEDSTTALTLAVTVQPSVSNVNVEILRQIAFAELIG